MGLISRVSSRTYRHPVGKNGKRNKVARHQRENYDASRLPENPPYYVRFGPVPYDCDDETVYNFLSQMNQHEILNIIIPEEDGRKTGQVILEVSSREALSFVMSKNGEPFPDSRQRQEVEYEDRHGVWVKDTRLSNRRGGGRYDRQGGDRYGNDRPQRDEPSNWRSGGSSGGFNKGGFGGGYNDRQGGFGGGYSRGNDAPQMTRKPLNLKPRGSEQPKAESAESTPKSSDGPKSDPFGGANAMTLTKQQEMDRKMEEKLNQQMTAGGDRFGERNGYDRRDNRGYDNNNRGGFENRGGYDNRGGFDRHDNRGHDNNPGYDNRGGYNDRNGFDRQSSYDRSAAPMQRTVLNLKKRGESGMVNDQNYSANSSIFGGAKAVDTTKRDQEMERKLMQAQSSSSIREEKGFGNKTEDIRRRPSDVPSQESSGNQQRLSSKDGPRGLKSNVAAAKYNTESKPLQTTSKFAGLAIDSEGDNSASEN